MIKSKLRIILEDDWESFVKYIIRKSDPILKCKDIKYEYIELKCDKCNETKKMGFTCKSRVCTSCGKIYVDNWIDSMLSKLINVRHRHIVFTIPEELREYFGKDRDKFAQQKLLRVG